MNLESQLSDLGGKPECIGRLSSFTLGGTRAWDRVGEVTALSVRVSTEELTRGSRGKRRSGGRFQVPRGNLDMFKGTHASTKARLPLRHPSCRTGRVGLGGGNERRLGC